MTFNIRLITILFVGIFIISTLAAYHSLSFKGESTPTNQPETPDSFMQEITFTRYDAQGVWESRFYTPHSVHYPKRNTTLLENPKLISRGDNQLVWVITAKHGKAEDDGKTVYLNDNVQIQRINSVTHQVSTMTTSTLTAYPQQKFLETDQPVTIIQPGSTIHAIGLNADLKTGDIHLLSNTTSTYAPKT